jgi:hypothetical protein
MICPLSGGNRAIVAADALARRPPKAPAYMARQAINVVVRPKKRKTRRKMVEGDRALLGARQPGSECQRCPADNRKEQEFPH